MTEPKKRIDILGDILNDSPSGMIRGIEELTKLTHALPGVSQGKTTSRAPRKTRKTCQRKKHKTTHYLTKEVFDNLGEAKDDIQGFLPPDSKARASKSMIVESAITVVLHEFEEKGKDSALIRELLKMNPEKP